MQEIVLTDELNVYMEGCEAESGSKKWFQCAFHAVAQLAAHASDYLSMEYYERFGTNADGRDETLYAEIAKIKKDAGLSDVFGGQ